MSIVLNISPDLNTKIYIWEINENENDLINQNSDTSFLKTVNNTLVRKQKLAVRAILKNLGINSDIEYSNTGKPHLKTHNIGISHSNKYVSIILSKNNNVAIDIETKIDKAWKLRNKFFHINEFDNIKDSVQSALAWSAKETYVKLHDSKHIEFSSIFTRIISNDTIEIIDSFNTIERYHYKLTKNFILVWANKAYS
ncbi:MAG TPA: hypothetical protein PLO05_08505 [Bacteroidales bacterium]|nr:hypothetical protein [Bacteroidales bacterium]HXK82183.1 hypothetical protein [Bacteroidales bacterium]